MEKAAGKRVNGQIPARVAAYAQRLYDHGRSPEYIKHQLGTFGYEVKLDTILSWCDEEYDRARRSLARSRRRQSTTKAAHLLKHERMKELKQIGLSNGAIAKLMKLDFGITLTAHQVRYILSGAARDLRRLLADEGDRIRESKQLATQEE